MNNLEAMGLLLRTLNPNDIKIIVYCDHKTRTVGELTKLIGIAQNNLIKRLKILEASKRLNIEHGEKGKRTYISIPKNIDPVYVNGCHMLFLTIIASEEYEKGDKTSISLSESDAKLWMDILGKSDSSKVKLREKFKELTKKYVS